MENPVGVCVLVDDRHQAEHLSGPVSGGLLLGQGSGEAVAVGGRSDIHARGVALGIHVAHEGKHFSRVPACEVVAGAMLDVWNCT